VPFYTGYHDEFSGEWGHILDSWYRKFHICVSMKVVHNFSDRLSLWFFGDKYIAYLHFIEWVFGIGEFNGMWLIFYENLCEALDSHKSVFRNLFYAYYICSIINQFFVLFKFWLTLHNRFKIFRLFHLKKKNWSDTKKWLVPYFPLIYISLYYKKE